MKRWDIFCKIVDNFGDIGVCWRLARQLQSEHGLQVRLWIDDLNAAKQLIPTLDATEVKKEDITACTVVESAAKTQQIQNITITNWHPETSFESVAEVVIEAFACGLPAAYLALMPSKTVWVNLEYLSAEPWIERFHLGSANQHNIKRHFFFPGFTEATGGLLRERNIVNDNQQLANSQAMQWQFLQRLKLASADLTNADVQGVELQSSELQHLNFKHSANDDTTLKVSLFCYPHAPIHSLLDAMAQTKQMIACYVPNSGIVPIIAQYFGKKTITAGESLHHKNLNLHVLPFLSQVDYDQLLSICDINFVRGEDSWIRAIWAGKPFIWQPYKQEEETHLIKLNAFLDLFYTSCGIAAKQACYRAHSTWLSGALSAPIWQDYLNNLSTLKSFTLEQTNALATQPDLATKLVIFSNNPP